MTPKQTLVAHLRERHRRVKIGSRDTMVDLARKHGHDHHHGTLSHRHGIRPNLGPGSRPEGWKTGEHVIERV